MPGRKRTFGGGGRYDPGMRAGWAAAVAAVVVAGAAGGGLWWYRSQQRKAAAAQAAPAPPQFVPGTEVSYTGRVRAQQVVQVAAPTSGEVQEYLVETGSEVAEGQLLARIHNGDLEAARDRAGEEVERIQDRVNGLETAMIQGRLEESRALADAQRARMDLSRAEKVYQRQQLLFREGATPRLVYEKAQRDYETVKAEDDNLESLAQHVTDRVGSMQKNLDNMKKLLADKNEELDQAKQEMQATEVLSPVDGLVVGRRGGPGEAVSPAVTDLLQIAVDLGSLEVAFDMPPDVARRLPTGYAVGVVLAELGGEALPGTVKSVQAGQVVAAFTSPNPAVRPGVTAEVRIKLP